MIRAIAECGHICEIHANDKTPADMIERVESEGAEKALMRKCEGCREADDDARIAEHRAHVAHVEAEMAERLDLARRQVAAVERIAELLARREVKTDAAMVAFQVVIDALERKP